MKKERTWTRGRLIVIFVILCVLFIVCLWKVLYIMTYHNSSYGKQANEISVETITTKAKRGKILDRNGETLVESVTSYDVYIKTNNYSSDGRIKKEFYDLKKKYFKGAISSLKKIVKINAKVLEKIYNTEETRVLVKSDLSFNDVENIRTVSNNNIFIETEEIQKRYYNFGTLLAHTLGTINNNGEGISGIELQYNQLLKGINGKEVISSGGDDEVLPSKSNNKEKTDGADIFLTIDKNIQTIVENEIKKAYKDTDPTNINAIVMDVQNGEVLGMASYPTFDPRDPSKPIIKSHYEKFKKLSIEEQSAFLIDLWKNKCIVNTYDPGSVFKLITVASALENGVITPSTKFKCEGSYKLYDRKIRCWDYPNAHGTQTVKEAVANSCNPVMIQIIQRLGFKRFYKYLELFGMTQRTGIDFPGETLPLIQDADEAGPVGLATMSFGQGLSVSPIQMINGGITVVNGGYLFKPHLLYKTKHADGKIDVNPKKIMRQIISKTTTDEMKNIMESVSKKTITQVKIDGVRVGVKSGTTQKIDKNGEYSKYRVVSSMLLIAPINKPKYAVYVQIDDPLKFNATPATTGPVLQRIMKRILDIK